MKIVDTAIEAALEAGELLKKGLNTPFHIGSKEGRQNLITKYDLLSQELIISKIREKFPSHSFLAEEGGPYDKESRRQNNQQSDEVVWIIDPLDGTVNFAHHLPLFAVSIAAAKGKTLLAGAIYIPMLDELFFSEKGGGAFLNKSPLSVSSQKRLNDAFVATGLPYDVDQNPLHCLDRFYAMAKKGIPIRRMGAAAIDLAYVAAGRFDAFWEVGLHSWDMAAGKLLIEEAGGSVSHYDGSLHSLYGYKTLLASNGELHEELSSIFRQDVNQKNMSQEYGG